MKFSLRILLLMFLISSAATIANAQNTDINLLRKINLERNTRLDGTMKFVSNSEAYIGIGIPVSVVIASYAMHDKKLLQQGINMCVALAASSLNTLVVKRLVDRQRPVYRYPDIQALQYEPNYSFPSGHTSNA